MKNGTGWYTYTFVLLVGRMQSARIGVSILPHGRMQADSTHLHPACGQDGMVPVGRVFLFS